MAYQDRLQPKIVFKSPTGIEFSAKWVGNQRSLEKQVGIFKTPNIKGVLAQDLDVRGFLYPLTFFFDGPENDREADNFMVACAENGTWSVVHPVHGTKVLQLVSVVELVQPVTSGNVTEITSEWLEVIESEGTTSAAQLSAEVLAQNVTLESVSADQLENVTKQDNADQFGKFRNAVNNVISAYDSTLYPITQGLSEVQAQADSIKRGIDSTLLDAPIDLLSIAGQLQALIGLPNLVTTDVSSKIDTYTRFANLIFDFSTEDPTPAGINTSSVQEIALMAVVGSVGVASVNNELSSRQTVIDLIESNISLFTDITDGLDEIQEIYSAEKLTNSYFSQSQSYHDAALLSSMTIAYLIKSAFDLAIEKRIVLTKQQHPVMLAMQEYGGPGEDDENINLFYDSNMLTGQETYLLPIGKEILIYI